MTPRLRSVFCVLAIVVFSTGSPRNAARMRALLCSLLCSRCAKPIRATTSFCLALSRGLVSSLGRPQGSMSERSKTGSWPFDTPNTGSSCARTSRARSSSLLTI
eukprot:Amastigsp_a676608_184.p5 type:complete len:104 gc:universal Amastigsp_a676608_184:334-645(+)